MRLFLTRGRSKACRHTPYRAHVVAAQQRADGEHLFVCPDCWNREGFTLPVSPVVRLADGLSKAMSAVKNTSQQEPDFGETNAAGERWITVHPHGDDEDGQPIKIRQNRDGSHTVVGGAGGALNGLRMTGVKSGSEYREIARQRKAEKQAKKKEKEKQQWNAAVERHKAAVVEEAKQKGEPIDESAAIVEAHNRAKAEKEQAEAVRAQEVEERSQAQRQAERALVEHWAEQQGWDKSEYTLSEDELAGAREQLKKEHLAANENIQKALRSGTPVEMQAARDKLNDLVENDLQRIKDAHHAQVLARAREVAENHRQAILTASDDLAGSALGFETLGDIAGETLGDSGKGYDANLTAQAEARGMDIGAIEQQAEELRRQAAIERAGGNVDKASRQQEAAQRRQEGAQQARERIERAQEKLGDGGQHLERLKELKTDPGEVDAAGAVSALAEAKILEQKMQQARDAVREAKDADVLETLPKAAIVPVGKELTFAEAEKRVLHDLRERDRQRAMGDLVDLYNAQDAISPLRSHLYSGHNAFWGNLAQVAAENGLNIAAPDPLAADILGPSGLAHVLRRAIERGGDPAQAAGLQEAAKGQHIETQVKIADDAVAAAKELLNQADNLEDFPIDSMDAMLAGLSQNEKRLNLQRQAREHLGVGLGRLEAAAALNEAFLYDTAKKPVDVALGAISVEDALKQAYAIGLQTPDRYDADGTLVEAGQFSVHHDGHNAILQIHDSGLDRLADGLQDSPEHLERIQTVKEIKDGQRDEAGWLPAGISRRPRVDVSRDPATDIPRYEKALDLGDAQSAGEIAHRLKADIAARIEAGQDITAIISHLRSEDVLRTQVPAELEDAYRAACEDVMPSLKAPKDGKFDIQRSIDHKHRLDEMLHGYHDEWLKQQVADGKMSSEEESVHRQTLPQTQSTRDLLYQVAIQDPRLRHAFGGVGELGRAGRRAVREYAYEHVFRNKDGERFDPKDKETPIQSLSPAEHKAWQAWRDLQTQANADAENTGGDPYALIQEHWKSEDEAADSGGLGSMFGDDLPAEPHDFASVDLSDDAAVIEAAKRHAQSLGYQPERRVTDLEKREYQDVVPELEVSDDQPQAEVARDARRRIQAALRGHAFSRMFGTPDVDKQFNPASVATASERWAHYVADMGGEKRAYPAIMDKMKGDFAGRFAKGYKQLTGHDWKTVHVPLSYADAHSVASLSHEKRSEVESQKAAERARAMNREGGKFAEGGVKERLDQQREEQNRSAALFGSDAGRSEEQTLETQRVSLGGAAEGMINSMLPAINLKSGTSAAGEINMSSGGGVKQQRAVKLVEAAKRLGLTLGTGCIHADTLIYDPVREESRTVHEWMIAKEAPFVWALDKNQTAVIAQASIPFVKAFEDVYRVRTQAGRSVTVGGGHKFLTPAGWKPLREIVVGERVFAHESSSNLPPVSGGTLLAAHMDLPATPIAGDTGRPATGSSQESLQFQDQKVLVSAVGPEPPPLSVKVSRLVHAAFHRTLEAVRFAASSYLTEGARPNVFDGSFRRLRQFVSDLRASIPGACLSVFRPDAGCSVQTILSSPVRCSEGCRQCGAQPRPAKAAGPTSLPSQADARGHIRHYWRLGAAVEGLKHSRLCQSFYRPSKMDFWNLDAPLLSIRRAGLFFFGSCELFRVSSPDFAQSHRRSFLRRSIGESFRHVPLTAILDHFRAGYRAPKRVDRDVFGIDELFREISQLTPLSVNRSSFARDSGERVLQAGACSQMPYVNYLQEDQGKAELEYNSEWDEVLSIDWIGASLIYDLEVYEYHNYLAHGLWHHNSGKTLIGLATHSHLKSQGKIKRSLFAVPSAVQEQFGSEAARFYDMTDRDAPHWFSDPGADTQTRRAAYAHDSGHDVCVVTHQALRDDLTWALAQHRFGGDVEQAKEFLLNAPEAERHEAVQQAADAQGWHFDLTAVDEGQVLLDRAGKENSAMSNAIDSFTHERPYHISMSADPVKNDASEAYSFLQKIAPDRYVSDGHPDAGKPGVVTRGEFLRRYAVNTPAAMQALQREMAPYQYADKIEPDAAKIEKVRNMALTPSQQTEYNGVLQAYQRVRDARRRGAVDVEAVKALSPNSFGGDASTHEATAKQLQESAGILRDAALARVVNLHPDGAKLHELDKILEEHPPGDHPKIIFAHHLGAVDMIHDHLKKKGIRVVKVDGTMSGEERERRKLMFNPQWDEASGQYVSEPQADVIVYSDAGEAGWNGQRASEVVHYDTPPTAKTYRQREGRAHRQGQRRDVTVHSLVTDTVYERRRREVLEKKDAMRDALTAATIDDNGLGERIRRETDAARQRLIESQVGELRKAA